ncbi:calcium/sodium antiporter [Nocardioides sp. CFH 31398]|uniref:calcium/sodium antiporter n=1 Tax=Nocardioides sp. CFH 31398 TaxID=2919579 RepID=UPI001F05F6C2|nr:calcium/sodium antiporter [Nocardioides sp. CFH 31398]MCH1865658.1 calcium/sodium antiporter [Nocardioides sp. CFH 31398]
MLPVMSPLIAAVVLVAGLALLVVGADVVVARGSSLAARWGVPPFVVGVTVVSIGTSLPELAVGVNAALQDNAGLAVGNIVGTNLVNLLLVLGLAALLVPVDVDGRTLRVDLPAMIGAAVLLLVLCLDAELSTTDGVVLVAYGVGYLAVVLVPVLRGGGGGGDDPGPPVEAATDGPGVGRQVLVLVGGLVVVVVGSELLVGGAVDVATSLGAGDVLVGLTVVAIGTSAPELVTTVVGTLRGERDLAIGNLVGSSIINIALVLGPTVVLAPGRITVPGEILAVDLALLVAVTVLAVPAFVTGRRLSRAEGGVFVATYLVYLGYLLREIA